MAEFNIDEIMARLPHRYPFLLVDRVLDFVEDTSIRALKNVSINEPHFNGHFPGHPVMPGVLIVEAMAQVGGVLALSSAPAGEEYLMYFTGIDEVRFRKPVRPGDQLIFEITVLRRRGAMWRFKGEAFVDGALVCAGTLMATVLPKEQA
ncbi:MAG: 3-hydroxyacyl-[acyl-carrier-protein] dehydratase FabZ [Zetaproteobacteria bacterium CG2_30_46_52]|nr:MAG: 3-hydroxyacyl-[acyl-carrier-protein] dehydratase FabZ [Zetaproteobacteria bacterium CG2_30_46_52]